MAQQLIYTSAGKLLDAGRSGFGTVARSKTLSPLLVSAIERVSQFANIRGTDRTRVLLVHRKIVAANNRIHLLSRIADAGADYTGRTNHIAHHLIVSQEEMARAAARGLTPADILIQFSWLKRWDGAPRFFDASDDVPLESLQPLGSQAGREEWSRVTGNPAHARLFAWDGAPRSGVLLVPRGTNPLPLLAQALREFGSQCWTRTFTTSLETTDEIPDFDWIVSTPENFPEIQGRCGSRTVLDLSQPHTLPLPPEPIKLPQKPAEATPAAYAAPISASGGTGAHATASDVPLVNVRVAKGSSANGSVRTILPPPSGQQRTIITLTVAAAVIMLGVLGFLILKAIRTDNEPLVVQTQQEKERRDSNIAKMERAGIPREGAELIVEKERENSDGWVIFITELINRVYNVNARANFNTLRRPPSATSPDASLEWLQHMIDARDELENYSEIKDPSTLSDRLDLLGKASKSLKDAASELPDEFQNGCVKFRKILIQAELDKFRDHKPKPLSLDKLNQLRDAFDKEHLAKEEWPEEYEMVRPGSSEDAETVTGSDVASGIEQPNPSSGLNEAVEGKHQDTDVDLSRVAPKQVIIVSRNDIKEGVEVDLLNEMFKKVFDSKKTQVQINEFKIMISPEDVKNSSTDLYFEDKEVFYSWSLREGDVIRFYKGGVVKFDDSEFRAIKFSFIQGNDTKEAWIVVDEKIDSPLIGGLSYELNEKSADEVEIDGTLGEWIKAIPVTSKPIILQVVTDSSIAGLNLEISNEHIVLGRKPQKFQGIIFSEEARNRITKSLESYKSKNSETGGTQGVKKTRQDDVAAALGSIESAIEVAIGGAIISKRLKLSDDSEISADNKQKIRSLVPEFEVKAWGAESDWAKEIHAYKEEIGEKKLNEKLKSLTSEKEGWEKLKDKNQLKIEQCVKDIINATTPREARPSLSDELKDKKCKITIKTASGRVLFVATPEKSSPSAQ